LRNAQESPHAKDLAAFVAVVEDGGYTGAARRLNVAPSTLSRAVAKLEELLGVTLLRRTTRSIALTDEGRDVLDRARRILEGFEGLHRVGDSARAPSGPSRVSAAVPFVLHVIAPCMAAFRERYPDIEITLTMTDSVVNLIESHSTSPFASASCRTRSCCSDGWARATAGRVALAPGRLPRLPRACRRAAKRRRSGESGAGPVRLPETPERLVLP